jgi:hypothetical protein
VRLKNRVNRLERQLRELRCAWCSFSLYDPPPPLPFLPRTESNKISVFACCWRCGSRFNIEGDSIRARQLNALFYSTNPATTYTDERARAIHTYIVRRYILSRKIAAQETEDDSLNYHERHQKQEKERQLQEKLRAAISPKAKARLVMYQRVEVEATTDYEKLRHRLGDAPRDMDDKTFAELEIIIFGDASDEAHALDAKARALKVDSD